MTKLLKHYWVDRDNLEVFAVTPIQYLKPMFGTIVPNIPGLEIVYKLFDENNIEFCLSTCPDETEIEEKEGLKILSQVEWDAEIAAYDARQEEKRWNFVRSYRDKLLSATDWYVIKSKEQGINLSSAFKEWRQSLRDLPANSSFPTELPASPSDVTVDQTIYSSYILELRSIHMINDPLPSQDSSNSIV